MFHAFRLWNDVVNSCAATPPAYPPLPLPLLYASPTRQCHLSSTHSARPLLHTHTRAILPTTAHHLLLPFPYWFLPHIHTPTAAATYTPHPPLPPTPPHILGGYPVSLYLLGLGGLSFKPLPLPILTWIYAASPVPIPPPSFPQPPTCHATCTAFAQHAI